MREGRGEYLPRLWTDKPVVKGGEDPNRKRGSKEVESLQIVRTESSEPKHKTRVEKKSENLSRNEVSGRGGRAPVTSLDRYTA